MIKRKLKIISYILILIIFTCSSVITATSFERLPYEVSEMLTKKEIVEFNSIDMFKQQFENYLYNFENYHDELDEELIQIKKNSSKPFLISNEKAIKDVKFLFKLLKYGYAGYQYFGGDQKFDTIQNEIIDSIKSKSIFSRLTTTMFADILVDNLRFIQDGHFAIANKGVIERYRYFTSRKFDFYKDEQGYYTQLEGEKAYLISVENNDYDNYIKLSINNKGEIVYNLGIISKQQSKYIKKYIQLKPVNTDEIKDVHTVLMRQEKSYRGKKTPYNVYRKQNIPIIEHRTASDTPGNRDRLQQFIAEAAQFIDEEYLIIDLRGNSGGSDIYASDWVENFTGIKPGEGLIESSLVTGTANKLLANSFMSVYNMKISELKPEYQKFFTRTQSGWTEIKYHEHKLIANDSLIIVLIDSGVASAGESFVKYLQQLSNVIFIGSNTAGLINFGNMGMCNLPYSKLEIFLCKTISLESDFKFKEGRGYLPDFWVNPEDALAISLKFINNYIK